SLYVTSIVTCGRACSIGRSRTIVPLRWSVLPFGRSGGRCSGGSPFVLPPPVRRSPRTSPPRRIRSPTPTTMYSVSVSIPITRTIFSGCDVLPEPSRSGPQPRDRHLRLRVVRERPGPREEPGDVDAVRRVLEVAGDGIGPT